MVEFALAVVAFLLFKWFRRGRSGFKHGLRDNNVTIPSSSVRFRRKTGLD